jgi:hypothetical protein
MNIPSPNPLVFPATPEVVFSSLWIKRLLLESNAVDQGKMEAEFLPYNADTKQIAPDNFVQKMSTDDLWTAINEVPEIAAAYAAILDSVAPMMAWLASRNQTL